MRSVSLVRNSSRKMLMKKFALILAAAMTTILQACTDDEVAAWNSALTDMNSSIAASSYSSYNSYNTSPGSVTTTTYFGNGVGVTEPKTRTIYSTSPQPSQQSGSSATYASSPSLSSSSGSSSGSSGFHLTQCHYIYSEVTDDRMEYCDDADKAATQARMDSYDQNERLAEQDRLRRRAEDAVLLRQQEARRQAYQAELDARSREWSQNPCHTSVGSCVIPAE